MSIAAMKKDAEQADELLKKISDGQGKPDNADPKGKKPDPLPEGGAPVKPTPAAVADDDAAKWSHKYAVLKGKYDAEVPRLHAELKALREEIKKVSEAMKPAAEPAKTAEQAIMDLQEEYGEDFVRAVDSRVGAMVDAKIEARVKPTEDSVKNLSADKAKSREDAFYDALDKAVPDWLTTNGDPTANIPADPRWTEFLTQIEPISGATYQQLLDHHYENMDAKRVAMIFKVFKGNLEPKKKDNAPVKNPLEDFIHPDDTAGDAKTADGNQTIISKATIDQFYRDVQAGKYRGRDGEKRKLELEYDRAVAAGKVK